MQNNQWKFPGSLASKWHRKSEKQEEESLDSSCRTSVLLFNAGVMAAEELPK